jgi:hypothetical protein
LKKKITTKSNKSKKEEKKDLKAKTYSTTNLRFGSTWRLKFFQNLVVFQNIKVNADALASPFLLYPPGEEFRSSVLTA